MIHHATVSRYPGDLAALAEEVGDLKYDALARFLQLLSAKAERDSLADAGRGRRKLAEALKRAAGRLGEAGAEIEEAWRICAPFMTERAKAQHDIN